MPQNWIQLKNYQTTICILLISVKLAKGTEIRKTEKIKPATIGKYTFDWVTNKQTKKSNQF